MSTGKSNSCITAGRLRPQAAPGPEPTPFPEDYAMLKFTAVDWITFDPEDVNDWNTFLNGQGSNVSFTEVQIGFGNVVKLAGNLSSPTIFKAPGFEIVDSDISKLSNLTEIDLSSNYISNTSIVLGLANLQTIKLGINLFNEIDFTSQRGLGNLLYLDVSNNELFALDVTDLSKITFLACGDTTISEITGLGDLAFLENLQCANNNITALNLANSVLLKNLVCSNNPIQNADLFIDNCTELLTLQANDCDFSGTFSYEFNTKCALVNLAGNAVENLAGHDSLTIPYNTVSIFLQDNSFGISEIDALLGFFSNNGKYPSVLKIDGTGNANIGGDPTVMGYYNDIAANGTIITANI